MNTNLQELYNHILEGDLNGTQEAVQAALKLGLDPIVILNEGMIAAMTEVGRRFEQGEYYIPELLISARTMQAGLAILKPSLQQTNFKSTGKVLIGTVHGDLHDIGKNLVKMMLEGAGYEIVDLGTDVSPDQFVEAVKTGRPDILAMSALLTTTMSNMKTIIQALEQNGLRGKVKIMIGGAPVTEAFARQIGADGFAPDASRAVVLAQNLIKQ